MIEWKNMFYNSFIQYYFGSDLIEVGLNQKNLKPTQSQNDLKANLRICFQREKYIQWKQTFCPLFE
jgi:hypothetical protein